jgi:hypothetical protein
MLKQISTNPFKKITIMQTLSLDNYGVSELSHSEQEETDGGIIQVVCAIIGAIWAMNELSKDAQDGWNSYKPKHISF